MQREEGDGVIISCDFCGSDWDAHDETNAHPMVEGHHGSVICLACMKTALKQMATAEGPLQCTLCLHEKLEESIPRWSHSSPDASPGLNPVAVVCRPCIRQAAGRFHRDEDVEWEWADRKSS